MTTRELTKLARRVWPEATVYVALVGPPRVRYWKGHVGRRDGSIGYLTVTADTRRVAVAGLAAALRAMAKEKP